MATGDEGGNMSDHTHRAGLPLADLLDSFGLHALLPAALAPWRPLVVEAMQFFLERLPAQRLMAIVAGQLALGEGATAAGRLVALLSHCPTLHKLGQVLARHPQLHPELRGHLQSLESMPPSVPMAVILTRLRDELGDPLPVAVADAALAEGSVAVVLPFTFRERGRLRHGVFKVLKPEVEGLLADELAILPALARFLERRSREAGLPPIDFRGNLASVRDLLTREVRLGLEQANLRAAAAVHADEPRILVPRLLPWCTPRVTAMERVFGVKVTDAPLTAAQRRGLVDTMITALLARPFWSRAERTVFHADLHGGNLFVADDGRLAVLDWSLTARLSKHHREALVAIVLGGLTLDRAGICRAVAALGTLDAEDPLLRAVVDRSLDRLVLEARLPGFDWLLDMLDTLALRTRAGFREDLALFRKSWLSLAGVIGDLVGGVSPDFPLLSLGVRRFVAELPARLLAPPDSPAFSTHVSNADLLRVGASSWLVALRYWTRFVPALVESSRAKGLSSTTDGALE